MSSRDQQTAERSQAVAQAARAARQGEAAAAGVGAEQRLPQETTGASKAAPLGAGWRSPAHSAADDRSCRYSLTPLLPSPLQALMVPT